MKIIFRKKILGFRSPSEKGFYSKVQDAQANILNSCGVLSLNLKN